MPLSAHLVASSAFDLAHTQTPNPDFLLTTKSDQKKSTDTCSARCPSWVLEYIFWQVWCLHTHIHRHAHTARERARILNIDALSTEQSGRYKWAARGCTGVALVWRFPRSTRVLLFVVLRRGDVPGKCFSHSSPFETKSLRGLNAAARVWVSLGVVSLSSLCA